MKTALEIQKDRVARSLAGFTIIFLLIIQKAFDIDLSIAFYCLGLNLLQCVFTGWCPMASFFKKIGWIQNY